MRILILGADGYLGWPLCMYCSQQGHEVIGVDNYLRRNMCRELDCEPLVPNPNLARRVQIWKDASGKDVKAMVGDITDYRLLRGLFEDFRPDGVVHLAEQPSAPYSMIDRERAATTIHNNLVSTLNVAYAVRETNPDCQIVKIGTMGEYGTPDIDIEEGWIEIEHRGRKDRFLFPRQASSLYHTTKIQDTDLLWFYVRTWGLRVTDLMQGPVYGIATEETACDERLQPNFNYDEVFGTVLNRFVVQAIADYPLTVYGNGSQVRGYLNLIDSLQCLYLSLIKPAARGELRIFNQIVETFSVKDLAEKVKEVGENLGYRVSIDSIKNPRIEKENHYYNPACTGLRELGLQPHCLTREALADMFRLVEKHRDSINRGAIYRGVKWN
ncbi:MAG TPA: NAD-dependent epimerase/dehydratase family protein [Syntrophobacter fumaroxidans]|nr:NAD-dependent epimerase/dehydratase family protein [Syntrophobacter fumaroxidans]